MTALVQSLTRFSHSTHLRDEQGWLRLATSAQLTAALFFGAWLLMASDPILGVHPALKPFKFQISGAILTATVAVLLPLLDARSRPRRLFGILLAATLLFENVAIGAQAIRGVRSHFNDTTSFDLIVFGAMGLGITAATIAMTWVAWTASRGPMAASDGTALPPELTRALRAGLWLYFMTVVSGFTMSGLQSHSVGGSDGGPGLPFFNWSTTHGDLRVSHFLSLHAIQLLPAGAWLVGRTKWSTKTRHRWVTATVLAYAFLVVLAYLAAMLGRPVLQP